MSNFYVTLQKRLNMYKLLSNYHFRYMHNIRMNHDKRYAYINSSPSERSGQSYNDLPVCNTPLYPFLSPVQKVVYFLLKHRLPSIGVLKFRWNYFVNSHPGIQRISPNIPFTFIINGERISRHERRQQKVKINENRHFGPA